MINSKSILYNAVKDVVIEKINKNDVIDYFDGDKHHLLIKIVDQYIFSFFVRTTLPKATSKKDKNDLVNECAKVVCMKIADFVDNKTDNL
ncbi:hypothetical protein [Vibrio mimicus]|uniref:hypothetical protein n=1 Tax=Vibrio mimicus TaxID=674 RepID=UPI002FEEA3E6